MLEGSTRKSSETSIADSQRPPRQLSEGVELKDFVEKDTQIDHLQKNHWLGVYQNFKPIVDCELWTKTNMCHGLVKRILTAKTTATTIGGGGREWTVDNRNFTF